MYTSNNVLTWTVHSTGYTCPPAEDWNINDPSDIQEIMSFFRSYIAQNAALEKDGEDQLDRP